MRTKIALILVLIFSNLNSFGQAIKFNKYLGNSTEVTEASISANGKFAICSAENGFHIWDVINKKELKNALPQGGDITSATSFTISNDGKESVFGFESGDIICLDVAKGTVIHDLNIGDGAINLVKTNPEKKQVVTVSAVKTEKTSYLGNSTFTESMRIVILDVATRRLRQINYIDISAIAISDDNSLLAASAHIKSGYDDPELVLFDLNSGKQILDLNDVNASDLAFSHDGKLMACVDVYKHLSIINIETGNKVFETVIPISGKIAFTDKDDGIDLITANGCVYNYSNISDRQKLSSAFFNAAEVCDMTSLKKALEQGADINTEDKYGRTALIISSGNGCFEITKFLLEKGAMANLTAQMPHQTAFMAAIENDHKEITQYLIDNKCDYAPERWFALGAASGLGDLDMVKLLLNNGAGIYSSGGKNESALMIAVQAGQYAVADYLLQQGVNPDMANEYDELTALMIAADNNRPDLVRLLLDHGANPCLRDDEGHTALDIARIRKYPAVSDELYKNTQELWDKDTAKFTLEKLDEYFFHDGIVESIVRQNHIGRDSLNSLLLSAARIGKTETARKLLSLGALVNFPDPNGITPLHYAIAGQSKLRNRDLGLVQMLIDSGANINAQMSDGTTPLMLAINDNTADFAAMLIKAGADVKIKNNNCLNAADIIIKQINDDASAKRGADLVNMMAGGNSSDIVSNYFDEQQNKLPIEKDTKEILISLLTDKGAYKNNADKRLVLAAAANDLELVKMYIKGNENLEQTDDSCRTPLDHAIINDNVKMSKFLIKQGAKINDNYFCCHG